MGLRPLGLVARVADFGLRGFRQHLVARRVQAVAAGARHVLALMAAAVPQRAISAFVTGEAGRILRMRFRLALTTEDDVGPRALGDAFGFVDVPVALTVAARARRRAAVGLDAVPGLADRE